MNFQPLTVRLATADDEPALHRLAQLDSTTLPPPPFLIGELAGRPVAALSLSSGTAIADPFRPTIELVDLLRLRSRSLRGETPRGNRTRRRLSRGAGRLRSNPIG